ncbi:MAG: DUF3388 domain-containing protein [Bacillaceae bacterium]
MSRLEWYMEYEIHKNRPGILGNVSSLIGMLNINIVTINGVDNMRRGMLLVTEREDQIFRLESILQAMDNITITKFRKPTLRDRLAVRHGSYIQRDIDDKRTFRFVRDELGILVDLMAELFKQEGNVVIGIRGMPRVGKTESIVAASVCANKRWLFVSSTLIKQTIRSQLFAEEYSGNHVYIIDGIVSAKQQNERHWELIREVMNLPFPKVIEHPDIFVKKSHYTMDIFDYIIELRNEPNEEITYKLVENLDGPSEDHFGMFDF